jgi:inner membrane protein
MATPLTHPIVPLAAGIILTRYRIPGRVLAAGIFLTLLPDLDVITFHLGIPYRHMLGHRGISHSLAFAFVVAIIATLACRVPAKQRMWVLTFLFVSALSHGVLDAVTDGGMGVAFFAPWSGERYHFPWRILRVSPLGMRVFSSWGLAALVTELYRIWVPAILIVAWFRGTRQVKRLALKRKK